MVFLPLDNESASYLHVQPPLGSGTDAGRSIALVYGSMIALPHPVGAPAGCFGSEPHDVQRATKPSALAAARGGLDVTESRARTS